MNESRRLSSELFTFRSASKLMRRQSGSQLDLTVIGQPYSYTDDCLLSHLDSIIKSPIPLPLDNAMNCTNPLASSGKMSAMLLEHHHQTQEELFAAHHDSTSTSTGDDSCCNQGSTSSSGNASRGVSPACAQLAARQHHLHFKNSGGYVLAKIPVNLLRSNLPITIDDVILLETLSPAPDSQQHQNQQQYDHHHHHHHAVHEDHDGLMDPHQLIRESSSLFRESPTLARVFETASTTSVSSSSTSHASAATNQSNGAGSSHQVGRGHAISYGAMSHGHGSSSSQQPLTTAQYSGLRQQQHQMLNRMASASMRHQYSTQSSTSTSPQQFLFIGSPPDSASRPSSSLLFSSGWTHPPKGVASFNLIDSTVDGLSAAATFAGAGVGSQGQPQGAQSLASKLFVNDDTGFGSDDDDDSGDSNGPDPHGHAAAAAAPGAAKKQSKNEKKKLKKKLRLQRKMLSKENSMYHPNSNSNNNNNNNNNLNSSFTYQPNGQSDGVSLFVPTLQSLADRDAKLTGAGADDRRQQELSGSLGTKRAVPGTKSSPFADASRAAGAVGTDEGGQDGQHSGLRNVHLAKKFHMNNSHKKKGDRLQILAQANANNSNDNGALQGEAQDGLEKKPPRDSGRGAQKEDCADDDDDDDDDEIGHQNNADGDNANFVKGNWTPEEDAKLMQLVAENGPKRWSYIANQLAGRIGKQCRERYYNHLDPSLKKEWWRAEEDRLIIEQHRKIGNQWSQMAKLLPGRTANGIKNHWHSTLKNWVKKLEMDGIDPLGVNVSFPCPKRRRMNSGDATSGGAVGGDDYMSCGEEDGDLGEM